MRSFLIFLLICLSFLSFISLQAQPHITGSWSAVMPWPIAGVHMVLLPNGKVLVWDDTSDDGYIPDFYIPGPYHMSVWDPKTNLHSEGPIAIRNPSRAEMFCGPHTLLPSGDIIVASGIVGVEDRLTQIYDWETDMWVKARNLNRGRYYPSITQLQDGSALAIGGYLGGKSSNGQPEVYKDGKWTTLTGIQEDYGAYPQGFIDNTTYFPWTQVAPNGQVFYAGPESQMRYITTAGNGSISKVGVRDWYLRDYGSYATYDVGKILVAGGGNSVIETYKIDINGGNPVVSSAGNMAYGRRQQNLTILADGSVMVSGGNNAGVGPNPDPEHGAYGNQFSLSGAVYNVEIWKPSTSSWSLGAPMAKARQYHSTALLLPDGRVVVAGGVCGPCHEQGQNNIDAEIYSPPYLFNADGTLATRPVITCAPSIMGYQAKANVEIESGSVSKVHLIKLGSVTHATNFDQRLVPLQFTQAGSTISIVSPPDPNIAPPGYYMLIVVNSAGVPSVARMVQLTSGKVDIQGLKTFESKNYPNYFISHTGVNSTAKIATLSSANATLGSFRIVPGLADPTGISFMSVSNPGYYLRHQDDFLRLHSFTNTALFKDDATFYIRDGLADATKVSFESKNYPGRFVRHYGYNLKISPLSSSSPTLDKNDATFIIKSPLNIQNTSIRSHNYPEYFFQATPNNDANISLISSASSNAAKLNSSFKIVGGLADASGVSFESIANPGYYLRHEGGVIKLRQFVNDNSFKNASTFYARSGFSEKNRFSFESKDLVGNYIQHNEFGLILSPASNLITQFAKDAATWFFEMPVNESSIGISQAAPYSDVTMSGPDLVCVSEVYTLNNIPSGASINWTVSPAGYASLSSTSGSQVTLSKISNGDITLKAAITMCNQTTEITKSIHVGGYTSYNDYTISGPTYANCNEYLYFSTNYLPGATSYNWFWPYDWTYISGQGTSQLVLMTNSYSQSGYVGVQVGNSCDQGGTPAMMYVQTGYCGYYYMVSPNPANSNITVSLAEPKSKKDNNVNTLIKEIRISDQLGQAKKRLKYGNSSKVSIDVSDLRPGIYILEIVNESSLIERHQISIVK